MSYSRRRLLGSACAWAGLGAVSFTASAADATPWRPKGAVTILNPLAAGGALDIQLRLLADRAGALLGQPVIVDAKPGAGTTMAGALVAKARPDGQTLAVILVNSLRYPHYQRTLWDPLKDFEYICGLGAFDLGVLVRKDARWKTIDALIANGREAPGALTIGTSGIGGSGHLIVLEIERATGARFTHVPYKGGPETQRALMSGEVDVIVEGGNQLALAEAGELRALALASEKPLARFPDTPTLRQRGIEVVGASQYGIVGPKGLSADAVRQLHQVFAAAMSDPRFQAQLDQQFATPWPVGPQAFRAWAHDYFHHIQPVLARAGLAN